MNTLSTDWGVLVAQPQRHKLVAEGLNARSVDYFMPMVEIVSKVNRRHHRAHYPLFGRYIVVAVDQGWRALQFIRGVAGIMLEPEPRNLVDGQYHGEPGETERLVPALVDPREIARVRAQCTEGLIWQDPSKPARNQAFSYGQAVTPSIGPFQNHIGVYDSKTRKGGDAAFFKLFGVERRIIFKSGELTAV